MFSRFDHFLFLLAQLIWVVPTYSRVTSNQHSLSNRLSSRSSGPAETVAATWYTGYHSSDFTLQDLSWSKYSTVIYAFAWVL
jgi:GH18 family chitinase